MRVAAKDRLVMSLLLLLQQAYNTKIAKRNNEKKEKVT